MSTFRQAIGSRFATVLALLALAVGTAHADSVTYYHHDFLGSPVAATDESGNVVWEKTYRPYGSQYESGSPASDGNRIGYTGHREDADLGLTYAGARYLDTELGRFTGMDLVGYQDGVPGTFNRYAYGNNNPYKYVDPDGNIFFVPILVFVAKELASTAAEAAIKSATGVDVPLSTKSLLRSGAKKVATTVAKEQAKKSPSNAKKAGRKGKQARLKQLANDPKLGRADRGWIKQEQNAIKNKKRKTIRNPPGKDLAHERGREAAKGYGYEHANLQDRKLHKLQHKFDNFGRKNKERPVK